MPQATSKPNQPAATVMFESAAPPMDSSLARMERFAPASESTGSDESAEVVEPEPPEESGPRPTPTRAKPKSKAVQRKGYKAKSGKPAKWSTSEDDVGRAAALIEQDPHHRRRGHRLGCFDWRRLLLPARQGLERRRARGQGATPGRRATPKPSPRPLKSRPVWR